MHLHCRALRRLQFSLLTHSVASIFHFFFFNDTATTEIYTLSLHDALPILLNPTYQAGLRRDAVQPDIEAERRRVVTQRSEERFSRNAETDLVCRLLLEKKKQQTGHQIFVIEP